MDTEELKLERARVRAGLQAYWLAYLILAVWGMKNPQALNGICTWVMIGYTHLGLKTVAT